MPYTYTPNLNLTKPGYDSPADIDVINSNMDKIDEAIKTVDASKLGGKAPEYYSHPLNLSDNSDLTNPVNQRGFVSGNSVNGYFFDRWRSSGTATITFNSEGLKFVGSIMQIVHAEKFKAGKTYTIACNVDGEILCYSGKYGSTFGVWEDGLIASYNTDGSYYCYLTKNNAVYKWVALYEGSYTVETLPEYQPKGYGAELAECQRYFLSMPTVYAPGFVTGSALIYTMQIPVPVTMRAAPSLVGTPTWYARISPSGYSKYTSSNKTAFNAPVTAIQSGMVVLQETIKTAADTNNSLLVYSIYDLQLSADL